MRPWKVTPWTSHVPLLFVNKIRGSYPCQNILRHFEKSGLIWKLATLSSREKGKDNFCRLKLINYFCTFTFLLLFTKFKITSWYFNHYKLFFPFWLQILNFTLKFYVWSYSIKKKSYVNMYPQTKVNRRNYWKIVFFS